MFVSMFIRDIILFFIWSFICVFIWFRHHDMSRCEFIGVHLFESFCNPCTWISVSCFRLRKFSAIISSNTFLTLFSLFFFWDLYDINVGTTDVVPEVP